MSPRQRLALIGLIIFAVAILAAVAWALSRQPAIEDDRVLGEASARAYVACAANGGSFETCTPWQNDLRQNHADTLRRCHDTSTIDDRTFLACLTDAGFAPPTE